MFTVHNFYSWIYFTRCIQLPWRKSLCQLWAGATWEELGLRAGGEGRQREDEWEQWEVRRAKWEWKKSGIAKKGFF